MKTILWLSFAMTLFASLGTNAVDTRIHRYAPIMSDANSRENIRLRMAYYLAYDGTGLTCGWIYRFGLSERFSAAEFFEKLQGMCTAAPKERQPENCGSFLNQLKKELAQSGKCTFWPDLSTAPGPMPSHEPAALPEPPEPAPEPEPTPTPETPPDSGGDVKPMPENGQGGMP